jgi:hypothetical protein
VLRADGHPLAGKSTNRRGKAHFWNVAPGVYRVCETLQDGWYNSQPGGAEPCYEVAIGPAQLWILPFGNHQNGVGAASADGVPQTGDMQVLPLPVDDEDDANYDEDPQFVDEDLDEPAVTGSLYLPIVVR